MQSSCKVCQTPLSDDDHYSNKMHLHSFKACAQKNKRLRHLLWNTIPDYVKAFAAGEVMLNSTERCFVNVMHRVHEAADALTNEDKIVRVDESKRDTARLKFVEILVNHSSTDEPDFEAFYMLIEESPSVFELEAERVAILLGLLMPCETLFIDDEIEDDPNIEAQEFPSNNFSTELSSDPWSMQIQSDQSANHAAGAPSITTPQHNSRTGASTEFIWDVSRWINKLQQNGNHIDYLEWFNSFLWTVYTMKDELGHKSVYKVDKRGHRGCGGENGCQCSPVASIFAAKPRQCVQQGPLTQRYFLCQMLIDCLAALGGIDADSVELDVLAMHCTHPLKDFSRISLYCSNYLPVTICSKNTVALATPNPVRSPNQSARKPFTISVGSVVHNPAERFSTLKLFCQGTNQGNMMVKLVQSGFSLKTGGMFICESLALRIILDILIALCIDCKCRHHTCTACRYGNRLKQWCEKLWNPATKIRIPEELRSFCSTRGVLNQEQAAAAYLASPRGPVRPAFAIWGPPGTGKTHTLGTIIARLHLRFHEAILAVAPTNTAADAIALAVLVELPFDHRYIVKRAYSSMAIENGHVVPNALTSHCMVFDASNPMQMIELRESRVVVCTVDSAIIRHGLLMKVRLFDVIVFDEAGRISIPECFTALALAKRAIFCGDHKQLRPYVDQNKKFMTGFHWDTSILQLIIDLGHPVTQLKKNYRSIKPILGPSNEVLYTGQQRLIAEYHTFHYKHASFALEKYAFLQRYFVRGPGLCVVPVLGVQQRESNGYSLFNLKEAAAVYEFIWRAWKTGLHRYRPEGSADVTIGVVSFYNAQNRLIQGLIDEQARRNPNFKPEEWFKILSVEQFQGLQANWVLLTGCRGGPNTTYDHDCNREMGFLSEQDRLNVALTRAKYGIVLFMRPAQYIENRFWRVTMTQACKANGFSDAAGAGSEAHLFRRYMHQAFSASDG